MAEFMNVRSTGYRDYTALVKYIGQTLKETDFDVVSRAYSAVASGEREREYTEGLQLKRTTGSQCIQRLKGKRCKYDGECDHIVPGNDHPKLWLKDGQPYSYTFEPYSLSSRKVNELVEFCERNDFVFYITNESMHFPTGTLFVEIVTKETDKQRSNSFFS